MLNRTVSFAFIFLLLTGAWTQAQNKDEVVAILLNNGDKIDAVISEISYDRIEFKAKSSKKAYEYGEVLNVERVTGIKLKNGLVMSVKEYRAYLKDSSSAAPIKKTAEKPAAVETPKALPPGADPQYEALKSKPISEMTQNEFEYFMMKEKERLAAQEVKAAAAASETPVAEEKKALPVIQPAVVAPAPVAASAAVTQPAAPEAVQDDLVNTLIAAGLAPALLNYLHQKAGRGETLTAVEASLSERIQNNPQWQERLDDIRYLDRVSYKALERAYIYNPDELQNQLGLKFDRDAEMDFSDLMDQLHRRMGGNVRIGDFRILVDLFDEGGARAVKELLENYATWVFATQGNLQSSSKN
jgi:hypothetical protein